MGIADTNENIFISHNERADNESNRYNISDVIVIILLILVVFLIVLCAVVGLLKMLEQKIRTEIRRSRAIQGGKP